MLYPENLPEKLGFKSILSELTSLCKSPYGVKMAQKLSFQTNYDLVHSWFQQVVEMTEARQEGIGAIPEMNDISQALPIIKIQGGVLNPEDILEVKNYIEFANRCVNFIYHTDQPFETIRKIWNNVYENRQLVSSISKIITPEGDIYDHASEKLKRIRKELESQSRQITKLANKILTNLRDLGYVPEGASLTVKNGRTVIPLSSEHKRHVEGYIQGTSATGQTVYLEPSDMIRATNQFSELQEEEKIEIHRLLSELTNQLHVDYDNILRILFATGIHDLVAAKLAYAERHEFIVPQLSSKPESKIRQAFHPLLLIANKREGKKTIPLSLEINENGRLIVVSGPNAGGKTVALKTLGLLQMMVQTGIPVPATEDSVFGIFKDIFVEIGDDQSIENELSTYSSHLLHLNTTLRKANPKSLILFDEFGSGTEPQIGGAIAQAALEELVKTGCKGIITTHYQNIKELAHKTEGLVNASMRYDTSNMRPLYELVMGKPGQSFAIDIAKNIGLPQQVITRAGEITGPKLIKLDELISETEQLQEELFRKNIALDKSQKELTKIKEAYDQKYESIKKKEKELINKAAYEAETLISQANKEIEKTIRHIKTSKAHKDETKKVRGKLQSVKKELEEKQRQSQAAKDTNLLKPRDFKVGDYVRLEGQAKSGVIKQLKGKNAEVQFGELTVRVKVDKLFGSDEQQVVKSGFSNTRSSSITSSIANFETSLNIRGVRAEEAVSMIDKFLDEAILAGVSEVKILHGKGEGVLRQLTRNLLKKYKQVAAFNDEHADYGGAGITVVVLK